MTWEFGSAAPVHSFVRTSPHIRLAIRAWLCYSTRRLPLQPGRVCIAPVTQTTDLISNNEASYGRPRVHMEGHYILPLFFFIVIHHFW